MSGPNGERCDGCYFWEKQLEHKGMCNRFPPQSHAGKVGILPVVEGFYWCGEFKPLKQTD